MLLFFILFLTFIGLAAIVLTMVYNPKKEGFRGDKRLHTTGGLLIVGMYAVGVLGLYMLR